MAKKSPYCVICQIGRYPVIAMGFAGRHTSIKQKHVATCQLINTSSPAGGFIIKYPLGCSECCLETCY